MIDFVEGELAAFSPTHLVVNVGGIGLHLSIPLSSFDTSKQQGERVRYLTHLHVREDIFALYGFATEAERALFRMLIGVSGIGPPMAQKVLSGISLGDFIDLVETGDAKGLTRIKGNRDEDGAASCAGVEGSCRRYCRRRSVERQT